MFTTADRSRRGYVTLELKQNEGVMKASNPELPPGIIHPDGQVYLAWWYLTVAAAAWTGLLKPYIISFEDHPGRQPFADLSACIEYGLTAIFAVDMILAFRVAYRYNQALITDRALIFEDYMSWRFWVDLFALLPFDYAIMAFADRDAGDGWLLWANVARVLRMLRMYRVALFFHALEYKLSISFAFLTLIRNFVVTYYSVHWSACVFYWVARVQGLGKHTWIGRDVSLLLRSSAFDRYVISLYWSMTTFSTNGYGDFTSQNCSEYVWSTLYMMFNLGLSAYILGSITLVVIHSDKKVGRYRTQSSHLQDYSAQNNLPETLSETMKAHLKLHFDNEEARDEQVLAAYPTTIRRRILRHLYLQHVRASYLFEGCRQKFLDALLGISKVELYMPHEDILVQGDFVNELFVVVAGHCEYIRSGLADLPESLGLQDDGLTSVHAGSHFENFRRELKPGDVFGEIAFFTEVSQHEGIRSTTVCRVLTVPRAAYSAMALTFPIGHRSVLDNLLVKAQQMVNSTFPSAQDQRLLQRELSRLGNPDEDSSAAVSALTFSFASPEMVPDTPRSDSGDASVHGGQFSRHHGSTVDGLAPQQEQAVSNLIRVRNLVARHIAKQDEARTNEFLYAASRGDAERVLQMLQQGFDVNTADYDGRSALMLACVKGHWEVVAMLLGAQANLNQQDFAGGTALDEACKHGHDRLIKLLQKKGAKLGSTDVKAAGMLCTCVFEGDMPLLRRYLAAGVPVDAGDYDKRTALHIAGAEGNLAAARLLIEEGGADTRAKDRWDHTALEEARRVGAKGVAEYLESVSRQRGRN